MVYRRVQGLRYRSLVQEGLLAEATAFRDANIVDVTSYDELKQAIEEGQWARGPWAGQHSRLATCTFPVSQQAEGNPVSSEGFSWTGLSSSPRSRKLFQQKAPVCRF